MIINQANLTGINRTFSTIFNQAFDGAPAQWPTVAMEVPSAGRSVDYKWLGDMPAMREWLGDRQISDLAAHGYEIINKSYESTIGVDRDDIDDDQIGIYTPMISEMAMAAKSHPDILVFALLAAGFATVCFDGQFFFDTDHPVGGTTASNDGGGASDPWYLMDLSHAIRPIILQMRKRPEFVSMDNPTDQGVFMRKKYMYGVDDRKNVGYGLWQIAYGSKDTLNAANYATARAAMMAYTRDDEVTKLGIMPTHLIHGPTNEGVARTLIDNMNDTAGATNKWFKSVERVLVPWMT